MEHIPTCALRRASDSLEAPAKSARIYILCLDWLRNSMDPFLSDRHARWHPVDLSLFPLRLSIITRSLTLARLTQTPVRTVVQFQFQWSRVLHLPFDTLIL